MDDWMSWLGKGKIVENHSLLFPSDMENCVKKSI